MNSPLTLDEVQSSHSLLRSCFFGAFFLGAFAATSPSLQGQGVVDGFAPAVETFLSKHCVECHDADSKKGGLDLERVSRGLKDAEVFALWVKVHDRVESGEMPPKKKPRPEAGVRKEALAGLASGLVAAEKGALDPLSRTGIRRLTRAEYENTMRDLFEIPGLHLQSGLPADGAAHGYDKNSDALDISHVNLARYMESADKVLDVAIARQPEAPPRETFRVSLAGSYQPGIMLMQGDAILIKDKKPDPVHPPAGRYAHIDQGGHEGLGMYRGQHSVAVFRHEDESWYPYFQKFAAVWPGLYRVRASFWSMMWDKGAVLPARRVETARLSVVQFNENGRGGGHPSYLLGYYDAPSLEPMVHETEVWLNTKDSFGFNTASLAPVVLYRVGNWGQVNRTMGFKGPAIVSDYLEVEGPINPVWPPPSHALLFGALPIREFDPKANKGVRPPARKPLKQEIIQTENRPELVRGIWSVQSDRPLEDASALLSAFLPRAFRRPVSGEVCRQFVEIAAERLQKGDCFELAMRHAFRAALCSPDFLYLVEPAGKLDAFALAARLSYFLWNSCPDQKLIELAASGKLASAAVLDEQVERLLGDGKSARFVEDFLGQWLKLRAIAANDPDKKLYPEFNPYLQDSMLGETRAYFREMLDHDLDAGYLVKSDFAMLNERLATHYGIAGVSGSKIRRVALPPGSERGGFLTQAAVLKVTANGTTTSPVPRGAYVMARLLGRTPEPPPPNVPAVEPDVRGATTIREQLDKHRSDPSCAGCHANIDPPGFALESFDVIGGFRQRYRTLEQGDSAERGSIDPLISIGFKLGPVVDSSGLMKNGTPFADVREFKEVLAADKKGLLHNLARQLTVYATGRDLAFSDRPALEQVVERTLARGGGMRTLLHEIVRSELFLTR